MKSEMTFDEVYLLDRAWDNFEGDKRALFTYAHKCGLMAEGEIVGIMLGLLGQDREEIEQIYFTFACFILLHFGEEF